MVQMPFSLSVEKKLDIKYKKKKEPCFFAPVLLEIFFIAVTMRVPNN